MTLTGLIDGPDQPLTFLSPPSSPQGTRCLVSCVRTVPEKLRVDPTGLVVKLCVCAHTIRSRGVHMQPCVSNVYPHGDPCGRRSKSSTVWYALDLLTMRQRGKKKSQPFQVDVSFIRVIRSSCNPSIVCFYICSLRLVFRLLATLAVSCAGSQQQLGKGCWQYGETRCVIRTRVQSRSRNPAVYICSGAKKTS